jgi:hypothetical protein
MRIIDALHAFLENEVNLSQARLDTLDDRVAAIVTELKKDSVIGPMYKEHIPQGSWAHRTIIRPVGLFDEFDADFLLLLEENPDWSRNPKLYLRELRAAFKRSSRYKDMVRKKNRCVRIGYANDCHVDVVAHLVLADGRQVIVNYAENAFEDTNPQGFTDWMTERDELANGNLRRVIRLLKYVRDCKNTFSCPSVILTTLLGEHIQPADADTRYRDVPTALVSMLEDLDSWLSMHPVMPAIVDPSCPGTSFNHRWDDQQYTTFREKIGLYAEWARDAYEETDDARAIRLWQKLLGPEFTLPSTSPLRKSATPAVSNVAEPAAPGEEFIEDMGFDLEGGYTARIDATVGKKAGFRSGPLRSMRVVGRGRDLSFRVSTDVPGPYDVYWKVRNRGDEAAAARDLRGKLLKDAGSRSHAESTQYAGNHYVEVYIVKNGQVLASDRHRVTIV